MSKRKVSFFKIAQFHKISKDFAVNCPKILKEKQIFLRNICYLIEEKYKIKEHQRYI